MPRGGPGAPDLMVPFHLAGPSSWQCLGGWGLRPGFQHLLVLAVGRLHSFGLSAVPWARPGSHPASRTGSGTGTRDWRGAQHSAARHTSPLVVIVVPSLAPSFAQQAFPVGSPGRAAQETWGVGAGVVGTASGFLNLTGGPTALLSRRCGDCSKAGCRLEQGGREQADLAAGRVCWTCPHTPSEAGGEEGATLVTVPGHHLPPSRDPFAGDRDRQLSLGPSALARGSDSGRSLWGPCGLQYRLPCGPRGGLRGVCGRRAARAPHPAVCPAVQ